MTTITRSTVVDIRSDIDAALAVIATKHGIELKTGRCTYDVNNFKIAVTGAAIGDTGTVQTPGRIALKRCFPEYVDKAVVLSNGLPGKVTEYHPRKRKYPFIVEVALGRTYKTSRAAIDARSV